MYICELQIVWQIKKVLKLSVTISIFSLSIHFFRHDGTDSPADAGDVIVVLNSFHSKIIKVRVSVFPVGCATVNVTLKMLFFSFLWYTDHKWMVWRQLNTIQAKIHWTKVLSHLLLLYILLSMSQTFKWSKQGALKKSWGNLTIELKRKSDRITEMHLVP